MIRAFGDHFLTFSLLAATQRVSATLCGFDEAPHQLAAEALYATKRIGQWMGVNGVLGTPARSAMALKWPQYIDTTELLDPPPLFHVTIKLSQAQSSSMRKFGLSCKLTTTVSEAVKEAFRRFNSRMGAPLDADGDENYVFKICGYNSYLLQKNTKLVHYSAVRECLREKSDVILSLRRLSDEEKLELEVLAQPAIATAIPYSDARTRSTESVSMNDIARGSVNKADILCESKDEKVLLPNISLLLKFAH